MLAWLPVTRSVELLNTVSEIHTITTSYYKRRARRRKRLKKVLPSLATAGQSKFKVLTIILQSLPTHLGTFWRHSANTCREAKSATRTGILSFAVLKVRMNDRKSREEFLSDIDCYLFLSSWAGGIQQILQSDWFLQRAEFSHPDRHSGRIPSSWSIFVNELAVIFNLSPFVHFHRRLINASLSLFTFKRPCA